MKPKKPDYASMFTLRKDGRYQGSYRDASGRRHFICDRDPERLFLKINEAQIKKPDTLSSVADEWVEDTWPALAFKTQEAYTAPLRRIKERFGDWSLEDITAGEISQFLNILGRQGYAKRTVQMHRDILHSVFDYAILKDKIKFNPASAVAMPRNLPVTQRELPDDDTIEAIVGNVDIPFGLFAFICLYTGLRRGEVLALEYEDIDRKNGVIHVTKSVSFENNTPVLKGTKTKAGVRNAVLLDALAAKIPQGKGYIFCRDDGSLLTKTQYRKRWQKYCQTVGINITAHQLRHGFATILYEAGIPDKDAQEFLGHASIVTTRNVYTHIRQSRRNASTEKLNKYLSSK